jgi:hypothetical protein
VNKIVNVCRPSPDHLYWPEPGVWKSSRRSLLFVEAADLDDCGFGGALGKKSSSKVNRSSSTSVASRPTLAVGAVLFGLFAVAGVLFGGISAFLNYRNSARPRLVEQCSAPRRERVLKTIESLRDGILHLNENIFTVENTGRAAGYVSHVTLVDVNQSGVELYGAYCDRILIPPGETRDVAVRYWDLVPQAIVARLGNSIGVDNRPTTIRITLEDDHGQTLYHARGGEPFEAGHTFALIHYGGPGSLSPGANAGPGGSVDQTFPYVHNGLPQVLSLKLEESNPVAKK